MLLSNLLCVCFLNFRILDDMEIYEKEQPFQLPQLCAMAQLANLMVFRTVWEGLIGILLLLKFIVC